MIEELWYNQDLVTQFAPGITKNYDLIILTGWSLYWARNPIFDILKSWIKQTNKPIAGICLWYEVLATSYDTDENYIWMKKIWEIHGNYYPIVYGWQEYAVFRAHKRIVIENESIYDYFDVLGRSELWIDIIKDTNRPHYGLSFHPELDSKWQATSWSWDFEGYFRSYF